MNIQDINWDYYFDMIKKRKFFIFGFFLLISINSFENWVLIGPIIRNGQEHRIFPVASTLHIVLLNAAIFALFAASWDFLAGYSGQVSFGHALFLGMGAYLSRMVKVGLEIGGRVIFPGIENNIKEISGIYLDISIFRAIFLASLLVSLFALFLGIFTLRMEGPYFALATLVLPLIAIILVTRIWVDFTGGDAGLSIQNRANLIHNPIGSTLDPVALLQLKLEQLYQVVLVVLILCVGFIYMLARSRYGLVLKSIREDELAASSSGINISAYKLSAIVISSFFASVAGGMYVQYLGLASSSIFQAERSFEIIIYTILGGIGTIAGSIVGTFIMVIAILYYVENGFVEDLTTVNVLIFGIILIVVLKYQPRGLIYAEPQLRNALFFGTFFSIFTAFFDNGLFLKELSEPLNFHIQIGKTVLISTIINLNPAIWLQNLFGENELGLLGINVYATEGRMILYFLIGVVIGYYGPELLQKVRLRVWGVWPSLGKFEPPK